ncbi:MAG: hypothetical protein R3E89_09355 [Thiolinea sp.]
MNAVTAHLFRQLQAGGKHSGRAVLEAIANELGHHDPARVVEGGLQTFDALAAAGDSVAPDQHPHPERNQLTERRSDMLNMPWC